MKDVKMSIYEDLFSDRFRNHAFDTIFFHISKPGSGDLHTRLICIFFFLKNKSLQNRHNVFSLADFVR